MSNLTEKNFIDIFKGSLKITPRTISIKTLLSERNLRRIDYKPYYQRNYVWDNVKQTFFIESVILGTEIPPLILFKSGTNIEVIDGRQRYETLKRFIENDFSLTEKGLLSLPALAKQNYNKLNDAVKEIFWNSNIRIFEFEVIVGIDEKLEDKIKKEIFRRYNTGITSLTSVEVDAAKYDTDYLSKLFEKEIKKDQQFYSNIKKCFFANDYATADIIEKMIDFLRRSFILSKFPISQYARGTRRSEIMSILYETFVNTIEDLDSEFLVYKKQLNKLFAINNFFLTNGFDHNNRFINETLLWGIRILEQENIFINISEIQQDLLKYLKEHQIIYAEDSAYFYKNIIDRFGNISKFFNKKYKFDFEVYLRKSDFKDELKDLLQTDSDAQDVLKNLANLRINKPSPVSKPIEEILSDVNSYKYLIRPSYQRQEKISVFKASSIIESILLGINLPPIFIYKRKDNVKEVIDGQQRLLSIIAFLGRTYVNENGDLTYSINNNFKLKGLKILDKNGMNYSALSNLEKDKILDFIIDEIIIEESLNEQFSATDLFIRLNQKPYPINNNSFEMWNSTVDNEVINKIKKVTEENISWFYSKERTEGKTDRMENEELITILSYLIYQLDKNESYDKVLGLFLRIDRITCRIKNKSSITDFLTKLDENSMEKQMFMDSIDKTKRLIEKFGELFNSELQKDEINDFFNVKKTKSFRRSYQDFYITWLVLNSEKSKMQPNTIKKTIEDMLILLKNANNENVDDAYFDRFSSKLNAIVEN
ncbi:Protein of unknown function DUF262 [Chryseobacterium ureilyticum]|uniref:GmrSD restriction endonucleases N-terminal domain-containing protein n=1 Tax=Chryseobacterium ureilyticum TaxID=373668 RepID=A0A1N7N648_9FLAO|nr:MULTISPECIES: DUF262 domain-containing protein [Chryseobacterium]MDR6921226.1 hypothetical protein [Chryseobacterium sp. 2987]SIS93621.1 Protein of unknown function DUF262 [Chryseobacterium ureilyticum]